jgi:hypothetical protein
MKTPPATREQKKIKAIYIYKYRITLYSNIIYKKRFIFKMYYFLLVIGLFEIRQRK